MKESELRAAIRRQAGDVCEYCRFPQEALPFVTFHMEHVVAKQHGGLTVLENLAWSCSSCNFHKGPNIASVDPLTNVLTPLFHPRRDDWADHFSWRGIEIVGQTSIGRATTKLLNMNNPERMELRVFLRDLGEVFFR